MTGLNGTGQNVGASLSKVGTGLVGIGLAAATPFIAAVKGAADLQQGLDFVQASTNATDSEIAGLSGTVTQLGKDTQFTSNEIVTAADDMAKAGLSVAELTGGALEATANLAAATGESLVSSGNAVADAMNLFGISGDQAIAVVDGITQGVNESAIGIDEYSAGFRNLGPIMASFASDQAEAIDLLDQTNQVVSFFTAQGLKGADAGLSFGRMIEQIASPINKDAAKLIDDLGLSVFDATGNFVGAEEVIRQLTVATAGLNEEDRDRILTTIFGTEALDAARIAASKGVDAYIEHGAAMDAQATAAEAAAIRMDNLKGAIELMTGSIGTALAVAGAPFLDALQGLAEGATAVINAFIDLPTSIQTVVFAGLALVGVFATLAGGALLFGGRIYESVQALKALRLAMQFRGITFAGLLGPLGLLVAAIALLGIAYKTNFLGFGDAVDGAASAVSGFVGGIVDDFGEAINVIQGFHDRGASVLGSLFAGLRTLARDWGLDGLIGPLNKLHSALIPIQDAISGVKDQLVDAVGRFQVFRDGGVNPVTAAFRAMGLALDFLPDPIQDLFMGLSRVAFFLQRVAETHMVANAAFEALPDSIKPAAAALGTMVDAVADLVRVFQDDGLFAMLEALPGEILQFASALGTLIIEVPVLIGKWLLMGAADFGGFISDVITGQGGGLGHDVHNVLVNIKSWAEGKIEDLGGFLSDLFGGGSNGANGGAIMPGMGGGAVDTTGFGVDLHNILVNVSDWAEGAIDDIWEAVKRFVGGGGGGGQDDTTTGAPPGGGEGITLSNIKVNITSWAEGQIDNLWDAVKGFVFGANAGTPGGGIMPGQGAGAAATGADEGITLEAVSVHIDKWVAGTIAPLWDAVKRFVLGNGSGANGGAVMPGQGGGAVGASEGITLGEVTVNISEWIVKALKELGAAVKEQILEWWPAIQNSPTTLAGLAIKLGNWLVEEATSLGAAVVEFLLGLWPTVKGVGITLGNYAVRLGNWIVTEGTSLAVDVLNFLVGLWPTIQSVGATLGGYAVRLGNWIVNEAESLGAAVVQFVLDIWPSVQSAGTTLGGFIVNAGQWVVKEADPVFDAVQMTVVDALKGKPIIVEPELEIKVEEAVEQETEGLVDSIFRWLDFAIDHASWEMALAGIGPNLGQALGIIAGSLVKGVIFEFGDNVARGIFTGVMNSIQKTDMGQAFTTLFNIIDVGIREVGGKVRDFITDFEWNFDLSSLSVAIGKALKDAIDGIPMPGIPDWLGKLSSGDVMGAIQSIVGGGGAGAAGGPGTQSTGRGELAAAVAATAAADAALVMDTYGTTVIGALNEAGTGIGGAELIGAIEAKYGQDMSGLPLSAPLADAATDAGTQAGTGIAGNFDTGVGNAIGDAPITAGENIDTAVAADITDADFAATTTAAGTAAGDAIEVVPWEGLITAVPVVGVGTGLGNAVAADIETADWSVVGTAVNAKLVSSLTPDISANADPTGAGGGGGLGATVASQIAADIFTTDFSGVAAAVQSKLSIALAAGTGASDAAAESGMGVGNAIATLIAAEVGAADFALAGTTVMTKIGEGVTAAGPTLVAAFTTVTAAGLDAVFAHTPYATQAGTAVGNAIAPGVLNTQGTNVAAFTTVAAAGIDAVFAHEPYANQAGTAVGTAVSTGILGTSGANTEAGTVIAAAGIDAVFAHEPYANSAGVAIGTAVATGFSSSAQAMIEAATSATGAAIDAVFAHTGYASSAGLAVGEAIGSGINAGISNWTSAIAATAAAAVTAAVGAANAAAGNPQSPAPVTIPIGEALGEGIEFGIQSTTPLATDAMHEQINAVIDTAESQWEARRQGLRQIITSIMEPPVVAKPTPVVGADTDLTDKQLAKQFEKVQHALAAIGGNDTPPAIAKIARELGILAQDGGATAERIETLSNKLMRLKEEFPGAAAVLGDASNLLGNIGERIASTAPAAAVAGKSIGEAIGGGIESGIANATSDIVATTAKTVNAAEAAAVVAAESTPESQVFKKIGGSFSAGMASGIEEKAPLVGQAIEDGILSVVASTLRDVSERIAEFGGASGAVGALERLADRLAARGSQTAPPAPASAAGGGGSTVTNGPTINGVTVNVTNDRDRRVVTDFMKLIGGAVETTYAGVGT